MAHFGVLWHFAVDVPYWDEWEYLKPGPLSLDAELSWDYLFARHNEHRIVPTRLQTWLLYRVDGWNLVTQQLLNFLFYGAAVAWLVWACSRLVPELPLWSLLAGAVFLLSPLGWENFCWGFQSQFHLAVFAFLLAAWLLGRERPAPVRLALGILCALLAVISQSAGVAAAACLAVVWAAWKAARAWEDPEGRRRELLELAVVSAAIAIAIALWARNYPQLEQHPPYAWPWSAQFWSYYVNVIALGFGFRSRSVIWGGLCLVLVVAPLIGLARRGRTLEPERWTVVAWSLGLLTVLAMLAMGRAGLDVDFRQAKSSRYAAIAQPLVLTTLVAWAAWLRDGLPPPLAWLAARASLGPLRRLEVPLRGRVLALALVWVLACCGHADDWRLKRYREMHAVRVRALDTLRQHPGGPLQCDLYPGPIENRLAEARRQRVSFAR